MGARKKISAEKRKEALRPCILRNCKMFLLPPRKMRLVADMIRGMEGEQSTRRFEVLFKRGCRKSGKVAALCNC